MAAATAVTWAEDGEDWDEFIDVSAECKGHKITVARRNLERADGDWVDPMLFAQDYTPAASTGFQVWDGCWSMVQLLDGELGDELVGKRVVELGSGTGLAGLCAAALGAHVLLSDVETVACSRPHDRESSTKRILLPRRPLLDSEGGSLPFRAGAQVTDYSLRPNVERNSSTSAGEHAAERQQQEWPRSVRVGEGSSRCATIDWTVPLDAQAKAAAVDLSAVEVVLAAECVWLVELVQPFVTTVMQLLKGSSAPDAVCYCCYRNRAREQSTTFVGMEAVVAAFKAAACEIVLQRKVPADQIKGEGGRDAPVGGDMLLYSIRLARPQA